MPGSADPAAVQRLWWRVPAPALALWAWRAALGLFAVAVLLLPIAFSVRFAAESGWWWNQGFERFNADQRTGLPLHVVEAKGAELRAYFDSDSTGIPRITIAGAGGAEQPYFSEREALHLLDVKRLFDRTYDAGWAALGFILAFLAGTLFWRRGRLRPSLARAAFVGGVTTVVAVLALGVAAISGFDSAFRQFHLVFFSNDLWQLSSRDRLIQMFPQGFFFDTTMLIGGITLAVGIGMAATGWWLRKDRGEPLEPHAASARGGD